MTSAHHLSPLSRHRPQQRKRQWAWMGIVCAGLIATALPAQAQDSGGINLSLPGVTVDLSVLNDSGQRAAMSPTARAGTSSGPKAHLLPGKAAPLSTLYITPESGFKKLAPSPVQPAQPTVAQRLKFNIQEQAAEAPHVDAVDKAVKAAPGVSAVTAAPEPPPMPELPAPEAAPAPAPKKLAVQTPPPAPAPKPVAPVIAEPAPAKAAAMPVAEPVVEEVVEEKVEAVVAIPAPPPPAPEPEPAPVVEVAPEPVMMEPAVEKTVEVAPPAPEPPAASVPEDTLAALTPPTPTLSEGENLTIYFDRESAKLMDDARTQLQALADSLRTQENLRLQLLAYAGDADMPSSSARRLSLSRALAVRSLLIEGGVRSTRIDVRALGNKASDSNTERVDITVIER